MLKRLIASPYMDGVGMVKIITFIFEIKKVLKIKKQLAIFLVICTYCKCNGKLLEGTKHKAVF